MFSPNINYSNLDLHMMENHEETTTTSIRMPAKVSPAAKKALLILSCILLSIGNCGGPLIMRLYFIHGGNRVWLSSFLETAGWPFIIVVLIILYFHRRAAGKDGDNKRTTTFIYMRPRLFFAVAFIGVLTGLDDYLYAYGVARLPISTSALILAPHLAFVAVFAYLLVKQKFTPYSINAVVLLTVGAAVLALHTSSDRPEGESKKEYAMGFVMTVAAALLYGFVLPLIELTYNKAKQEITYTLVVEIQIIMCLFATVFCTVGMIANNDFELVGYADAGYLSDPHKARSQTGYVFTYGGTTISWKSTKQTLTATSSNHAELIALYETGRECVWLRSMINHIQEACSIESIKKTPTIIHEDNAACIAQIREGYIKGDKTKHISPKFFSTYDLQEDGEIDVQQIKSSDNLADLFTKSLPRSVFEHLSHRIGLRRLKDVC